MTQQRPTPSDPAAGGAAALRRTGASPLRSADPRRIGPYLPLALLGSGGMGRVYLARPADGGAGLVAVKVIRPEYADDPGFRRRFQREASVHARVRTPHTPRLCGTGFEDELLWMATEYVPGLDLAEAVRDGGALPTAALWRLVAELGRALAGLATAEIVHRDLKPSNVLLAPRGAYVIDFGLSKAVDASALTGTGNRVGTPAFMAPEHLREGRTDTASDVFSMAGTLVYAATGHAPFGDGTGVDVMHRVAYEAPNPELLGEISATDPALAGLLSACLAKDPGQRPTPEELIDAAAPRLATAVWPEPLAGAVLARQRAYEEVCGLPAEERDVPASPESWPDAGDLPALPESWPDAGDLPPPPERDLPAPTENRPESLSPARAERAAVPGAGDAGPGRARVRRKPLLVAAAGAALCAVAAGAFVLTRPDGTTGARSPGAEITAGGTLSGPGASAPGPGGTAGAPASGKSADGASRPDAEVSSPGTSPPRNPDRRSTPPSASGAPGAEPPSAAPTEAAPPSSAPPTEPADPPWLTDCAYYSGNGRTRQGDSGRRVQQVQCMLTKRGYSAAGTDGDGDFGPGTDSAVRSFQSDQGLDADGVVDHATWTALRGAG
ncbi:protein kinase [Streptomyces sp. NPDC052682]|uniref:protein kinase domain-containing protein n=1 Tax=Streptomyces sp. NPDC052682 TaxID=3154954 RepID=UPI00341F6044